MKRLQAIIAAAIVTGLVALCMMLIGVNALLNPNTVQASNAPGSAAVSAANPAPNNVQNNGASAAQITELQNQIAQYQQQLDQANAQLGQYQQILQQLQQVGVIRITGDGQILLRGGRGGDGD